MKNNRLYISLLLFIISISDVVMLKAEPVTGEKNIVDYYLQLPDEYFFCETLIIPDRKDKLSLIKKKNLKDGYILASTKDGDFPLETALFTDDYMGLKLIAVNVRCGSGCMCRKLDFFFVSDGKLMKSANDYLFPKNDEIEKAAGIKDGYEFSLPGDGKYINVIDGDSGKVLLKIEWSGGTFNIK